MMSDVSQTPTGLVIEKRNWKFGRDMLPRRWWHGGEPGRTAFYNALSSTFPVGERFFMSAVRHYRDDAPEPLREQIDDFIFQESTHSRSEEHTSELQSLMRNSYAVFCLKKKKSNIRL